MMRSLFFWSIVATPQAVAVPLASNLQPHVVPAGTPHCPLSIWATQKPDPGGRPNLLPAPLTAISSSPVPVAPLLQVNVPAESLRRTLSAPSHTRLVCSAVPLPSTSICSAHESESGGVATFTFCPTLLVFVVPAGGGVPAFFCTCDGLTCSPAAELCVCVWLWVWATATATPTSSTITNEAYPATCFAMMISFCDRAKTVVVPFVYCTGHRGECAAKY